MESINRTMAATLLTQKGTDRPAMIIPNLTMVRIKWARPMSKKIVPAVISGALLFIYFPYINNIQAIVYRLYWLGGTPRVFQYEMSSAQNQNESSFD